MDIDGSLEQTQKSYPLIDAAQADGLVVHCSDPRFQVAFHDFVAGELDIRNPIPIIIPGGIHDLISPVRIKAARQLWQQLEFMLSNRRIKRIILINHEDCLWYAKWNALVRTKVTEDIVNHLLSAAEKLLERRLNLSVEAYYARISDGAVVFQRLDA